MRCPVCHVQNVGRVVCPACGCNFLNLRVRRSGQGQAQNRVGWSIAVSGRIVLMAALLLSLAALGPGSESAPALGVLTFGLSGAIAGMLLLALGHYLISYSGSTISLPRTGSR